MATPTHEEIRNRRTGHMPAAIFDPHASQQAGSSAPPARGSRSADAAVRRKKRPMKPQRLNLWAREVHLWSQQLGRGVTAAEAAAQFGPPPSTSTASKVLERAALGGFFTTTKRRIPPPSTHGRWFVAVYLAVGDTPAPYVPPCSDGERKLGTGGYFDSVTVRATSIFDLAGKV